MKRMGLIVAAVLVAASVAQAQYRPDSVTVGTTNVVLLPDVKPMDASQWVTNYPYVRGDVIVTYTNTFAGNEAYFWCVTAGTASNTLPVWGTNDVSEAGGPTWRKINNPRRAFTIEYHGSALLSLGLGYAAESGKGIVIYGGGSYSEGYSGGPVFQGEVRGVTSSSSANVSVQEK